MKHPEQSLPSTLAHLIHVKRLQITAYTVNHRHLREVAGSILGTVVAVVATDEDVPEMYET